MLTNFNQKLCSLNQALNGGLVWLVTSIGTQILTWVGLGLTNWFVVLTAVFVVLFVALGLRELKWNQDDNISFWNAFLSVVIIILVARYIFQLYMFIYINYIDPEWVDTVADSWSQTMLDEGLTSTAVGQRIMAFRSAWESINIFTIEVVKYGITQILSGLFVALFFVFNIGKKKSG